MNIDHAWLNDDQLALISRGHLDDQTRADVRKARYAADCPSECYRGIATVLSIVAEGMRQGRNADRMSDEVDQGLKTSKLPASNDLSVGAFLANLNVMSYIRNAPNLDFLADVIEAELICTAQFFFENHRKGL